MFRNRSELFYMTESGLSSKNDESSQILPEAAVSSVLR